MKVEPIERVQVFPGIAGAPPTEVRFPYWQCPRCPYGTASADYIAAHSHPAEEPAEPPAVVPPAPPVHVAPTPTKEP